MPDTTPLPECPREGCPVTIDHWHDGEGMAYTCSRQLGRTCPSHENMRLGLDRATRCYAPRTVPAEDERVAVVVEWLQEGLELDGIADAMQADAATARDLLARIDKVDPRRIDETNHA